MNEYSKTPFVRQTSQAAEGLPRWRWTLDEFDRMIEVGLLGRNDRVELIDGEMVPMAAKGIKHENLKSVLINSIFRQLPIGTNATVELGWRPAPDLYLEPDIVLYPATQLVSQLVAAEVLLLIEISDSSLRYDRERKVKIYAALGVREYWVIDANSLQTTVHLDPGADGYASVSTHAPSQSLAPKALPVLAVSLGGLNIG